MHQAASRWLTDAERSWWLAVGLGVAMFGLSVALRDVFTKLGLPRKGFWRTVSLAGNPGGLYVPYRVVHGVVFAPLAETWQIVGLHHITIRRAGPTGFLFSVALLAWFAHDPANPLWSASVIMDFLVMAFFYMKWRPTLGPTHAFLHVAAMHATANGIGYLGEIADLLK